MSQLGSKTFLLGPFELESPFVLAPMAGITNSAFRRLMRKHEASLVISELISANGMIYQNRRTREMLKFDESERPVGIQIFGESEQALVHACQVVEGTGVDFVDLNLGCPVPKVVRNGAGAALCRSPKALELLLVAMVKALKKIPLTIKIRTGWDEMNRNAAEVIQVAEDSGVAWVSVHGRTRAQGYSGLSDWNFISELKSRTRLPLIGNGDLSTPERAVSRLKDFGVDAVMIGRGALRNPFIFAQAKQLLLSGTYLRATATEYLDLLSEQKSILRTELESAPLVATVQSKKFLSWYSAGFHGASEFRRQIFQAEGFENVWTQGREFFEKQLEDRDLDFLSEAFLMGGHG